ncbi:MAG: hypothetical protein Q8M57_05975 [Nitrosomonas sp.]|nr:hypothetical protein [Nitrosomonas sp.]
MKSLRIAMMYQGVNVEGLEAYDILKYFGCEIVQGYLFSKPINVAALSELLRNETHKKILGQYRLDKIA